MSCETFVKSLARSADQNYIKFKAIAVCIIRQRQHLMCECFHSLCWSQQTGKVRLSEHEVMCVCMCHSPFFAIDRFSGGCSNNGTYKAPEHPWHSVQVVNTTCILDLEIFLHEGLQMRKTVTHYYPSETRAIAMILEILRS